MTWHIIQSTPWLSNNQTHNQKICSYDNPSNLTEEQITRFIVRRIKQFSSTNDEIKYNEIIFQIYSNTYPGTIVFNNNASDPRKKDIIFQQIDRVIDSFQPTARQLFFLWQDTFKKQQELIREFQANINNLYLSFNQGMRAFKPEPVLPQILYVLSDDKNSIPQEILQVWHTITQQRYQISELRIGLELLTSWLVGYLHNNNQGQIHNRSQATSIPPRPQQSSSSSSSFWSAPVAVVCQKDSLSPLSIIEIEGRKHVVSHKGRAIPIVHSHHTHVYGLLLDSPSKVKLTTYGTIYQKKIPITQELCDRTDSVRSHLYHQLPKTCCISDRMSKEEPGKRLIKITVRSESELVAVNQSLYRMSHLEFNPENNIKLRS